MENRTSYYDQFLDRKARLHFKVERMVIDADPRARRATQTFSNLAGILGRYTNVDHRDRFLPSTLHVEGVDGTAFTSVLRLQGASIANFPSWAEPDKYTDSMNYSLMLPKELELQENQVAVMITPRSQTTDIENQQLLYNRLRRRNKAWTPWADFLYPDVFYLLPPSEQRHVLVEQGSSLFGMLTTFAPDLYVAREWSPAYNIVRLTGRFHHPLFGSAYYKDTLRKPDDKIVVDKARTDSGMVDICESHEISSEREKQIQFALIQRHSNLYILQKDASKSTQA